MLGSGWGNTVECKAAIFTLFFEGEFSFSYIFLKSEIQIKEEEVALTEMEMRKRGKSLDHSTLHYTLLPMIGHQGTSRASSRPSRNPVCKPLVLM